MKRRMICDDIMDSGKFLRLPPSTQALYSHCVLGTDDDGIVDVFTIMRKVGAKEDDVVLLVEREFITPLDHKEYIFWVTGFQDFNKIPAHIKEDSKYIHLLLATVQGIELVKSTKDDDNKRRYAQLKEKRKLQQQVKLDDPIRIIIGSSLDHGHDPISRLGKDRLEKDNNTTDVASTDAPIPEKRANETFLYWEEQINGISQTVETQKKACITLQNKYGLEECLRAIRIVLAAHQDRYARKEIKCLSPLALLNNWDKVQIYAKSKNSSNRILEAS